MKSHKLILKEQFANLKEHLKNTCDEKLGTPTLIGDDGETITYSIPFINSNGCFVIRITPTMKSVEIFLYVGGFGIPFYKDWNLKKTERELLFKLANHF